MKQCVILFVYVTTQQDLYPVTPRTGLRPGISKKGSAISIRPKKRDQIPKFTHNDIKEHVQWVVCEMEPIPSLSGMYIHFTANYIEFIFNIYLSQA